MQDCVHFYIILGFQVFGSILLFLLLACPFQQRRFIVLVSFGREEDFLSKKGAHNNQGLINLWPFKWCQLVMPGDCEPESEPGKKNPFSEN